MDKVATLPSDVQRLLHTNHDMLWAQHVSTADSVPSYGRKADLDRHFEMLEKEFAGQPAALLYHACLIVQIRRGVQLENSLEKFFALWDQHCERLTSELDSRWLVSALDTFSDHGRNSVEHTTAMAGVLLVNTIKLYETERLVTGQRDNPGPYAEIKGRQPLHDGLTAFVIGEGDMVRNMLERTRRLNTGNTGSILQELLNRSCCSDTVFKRFRSVHKRTETMW